MYQKNIHKNARATLGTRNPCKTCIQNTTTITPDTTMAQDLAWPSVNAHAAQAP